MADLDWEQPEETTCTMIAWCRKATDKARYIESEHYTGWVPFSVIHDDSEVYEPGDHGKLILKGWWALKQGLWED